MKKRHASTVSPKLKDVTTISCDDYSDKKNSGRDNSQGHLDGCVSQGRLPGGGDINPPPKQRGVILGDEEDRLECVKSRGRRREAAFSRAADSSELWEQRSGRGAVMMGEGWDPCAEQLGLAHCHAGICTGEAFTERTLVTCLTVTSFSTGCQSQTCTPSLVLHLQQVLKK